MIGRFVVYCCVIMATVYMFLEAVSNFILGNWTYGAVALVDTFLGVTAAVLLRETFPK